uniref:Uncharacterized protein n=1 Tax=Ascaris lumbricoides TaxID=6252 RepID=A0A0M3IJN1_ASCLU
MISIKSQTIESKRKDYITDLFTEVDEFFIVTSRFLRGLNFISFGFWFRTRHETFRKWYREIVVRIS